MKNKNLFLFLIPFIWYMIVALSWSNRINRPFTHDEPHYFVITNSIIKDLDFDIKNNYEDEARNNEFIGTIDRHGIEHNGGFFSQHGIGVPLLLTPYVYLFGFSGIKFYLVCLIGLLTFFIIYKCLNYYLSNKLSTIIAVTYLCSIPFILSSSLAFPEQIAGAISCYLILVLFKKYDQTPIKKMDLLFSFIGAGFLALLNFRYIVISGAFSLLYIYLDRTIIFKKHYYNKWNIIYFSLFSLIVLLTLLYNQISFGGILANGYEQKQLYFDLPSVSIQMLSFLIDPNQGMFCQEILVFCTLPILISFFKEDQFKSIVFAIFFLFILIPGSLVLFHHQGAGFIATRFTWPLTLLFIFPVGYLVKTILESTRKHLIYIILGFSFAFNFILFCFWIEDYTENIYWHKSCNYILNLPGLEQHLPHFRDYDDFARDGINIIYLIFLLILIIAPRLYHKSVNKLKPILIIGIMSIILVMSYLYIYNLKTWFFTEVFSPKNTFYSVNLGKQTYTNIKKDRYADIGWSVQHHTNNEFTNISFGPYMILTKGKYLLKVSMKSNLNTNEIVGNVDAVYQKDNTLHTLHNKEFSGLDIYSEKEYRTLEIPIQIDDDHVSALEFRIFTKKEMDISINKINIENIK